MINGIELVPWNGVIRFLGSCMDFGDNVWVGGQSLSFTFHMIFVMDFQGVSIKEQVVSG